MGSETGKIEVANSFGIVQAKQDSRYFSEVGAIHPTTSPGKEKLF